VFMGAQYLQRSCFLLMKPLKINLVRVSSVTNSRKLNRLECTLIKNTLD
jgi:hypothetical protein